MNEPDNERIASFRDFDELPSTAIAREGAHRSSGMIEPVARAGQGENRGIET